MCATGVGAALARDSTKIPWLMGRRSGRPGHKRMREDSWIWVDGACGAAAPFTIATIRQVEDAARPAGPADQTSDETERGGPANNSDTRRRSSPGAMDGVRHGS